MGRLVDVVSRSFDHGGADGEIAQSPLGCMAAQSICTRAALATSAHFLVSSARKASNSCGVVIFAVEPNFASVSCICGVFRLSLIAALRRATAATGVPAGGATPGGRGGHKGG